MSISVLLLAIAVIIVGAVQAKPIGWAVVLFGVLAILVAIFFQTPVLGR